MDGVAPTSQNCLTQLSFFSQGQGPSTKKAVQVRLTEELQVVVGLWLFGETGLLSPLPLTGSSTDTSGCSIQWDMNKYIEYTELNTES